MNVKHIDQTLAHNLWAATTQVGWWGDEGRGGGRGWVRGGRRGEVRDGVQKVGRKREKKRDEGRWMEEARDASGSSIP